MTRLLVAGLLTLGLVSPGAHAHGESHTPKSRKGGAVDEKAFGRPGDPQRVNRSVRIDMDDAMHYSVDTVKVKKGETIRFVARNRGKLMHEMVLGTPREIAEHAELMRRFPNMEHDEEYQLHVKPGTTGEMVWQFTRSGVFKFACLMPGHYQAGMVGRVIVEDERGAKSKIASERGSGRGTGG